MARADSLKKAVKAIIEQTEKAVDEQNSLQPPTSPPDLPSARGKRSGRKWPKGLRGKRTGSQSQPQSPHSLQFPLLVGSEVSSSVDEEGESSGLPGAAAAGSDSTVPEDPKTAGSLAALRDSTSTASGSPASGAFGTSGSRFAFASDSEAMLPKSPVVPGFKSSLSDTSLRDLEASGRYATTRASYRLATSTQRRLMRQKTEGSSGLSSAMSRSLLAPGLASGSLISQVLLLNADVLASAGPDFQDVPLDAYKEAKTMSNYFSIGLDAKIAWEFHQKREERPEKSRSRSKLYMWYGMLGGKELLQKTYRNLEQIIHLECDGVPIRLPSLQGIVVLNIPSYHGGANFWGTTKEGDSTFSPQSMDDGTLEVVAIFGVIHCATSRVIRLQKQRIAQCRTVRIRITGSEAVPVQVDGEPWVQAPAALTIRHKHRAQVLVRNREFERALRSWTESGGGGHGSLSARPSAPLLRMLGAGEAGAVLAFLGAAAAFVRLLEEAVAESPELGRRIGASLGQASVILARLQPNKRLAELTHLHYHLTDAVGAVKALVHQISAFSQTPPPALLEDDEAPGCSNRTRMESGGAWASLSRERKRLVEDSWRAILPELRRADAALAAPSAAPNRISFAEASGSVSPDASSVGQAVAAGAFRPKAKTLTQWLRATASRIRHRDSLRRQPSAQGCRQWSIEEVGCWLGELGLGEHRPAFEEHRIDGYALLRLERKDMTELGVGKIGDLKRLQGGLSELSRALAATPDWLSG